MMTKTFMVDDRELTVAYSAATPITYNSLFPDRDYFRDIADSVEGKDTIMCHYRFAYTGAYTAEKGNIKAFPEWLDDFDLSSFVQALSGIWEFMNGNNRTSSKSKKK